MKHFLKAVVVVVILAGVAVFSVTGAPALKSSESDLEISVQDPNPWTNLDVNNKPDNFQFAIVTDRTGGRRPGIFTRAVEKLNLLQPEFVMSVGDLINGYTEDPGEWTLEWAEFESKLDELQMPFFFCAGNHDISNAPMSAEWHRKFGRSYYHFRYRNVLFVVLNSEDPPSTKELPYNFSEKQQRWVAEILKQNKDVRWTFVFLHKPTWTFPEADPVALGWAAIEDALSDRPYTVFAGHKHTYAKYIRRGREYYMLATTGGASPLTGLAEGRFDHFVWVTMQEDRPVITNLLLDGVKNTDFRVLPDPLARRPEAAGK